MKIADVSVCCADLVCRLMAADFLERKYLYKRCRRQKEMMG